MFLYRSKESGDSLIGDIFKKTESMLVILLTWLLHMYPIMKSNWVDLRLPQPISIRCTSNTSNSSLQCTQTTNRRRRIIQPPINRLPLFKSKSRLSLKYPKNQRSRNLRKSNSL